MAADLCCPSSAHCLSVLLFESGTAEERARLVFMEIIRLVHGLSTSGGRGVGVGGGSAGADSGRRDVFSSDAADLLDRYVHVSDVSS